MTCISQGLHSIVRPTATKPRVRPAPLVIPQTSGVPATLQALQQRLPTNQKPRARSAGRQQSAADLAQIRLLKRRALREQVTEMRRTGRK